MGQSIKINLQWDGNGRLNYSVSGTPDNNDFLNGALLLSGPLALSHELGTLRPSYSIILCSKILQIIQTNNYILLPINSALKGATIEIIFGKNSPYLLFKPKHSLLANNDSLEEGVNQLISNYIFYIKSKLGEIGKIYFATNVLFVMKLFLGFLSDQINAGKVSKEKDVWNSDFPQFTTSLNISLANNFKQIDDSNIDLSNPDKELSDWINIQTTTNNKMIDKITSELTRLSKVMAIS